MELHSTGEANVAGQISAKWTEGEFDPMTIDEPVFQTRAGRNGQIINDLGWRGSGVTAPGQ
jgi:hypothetical protein